MIFIWSKSIIVLDLSINPVDYLPFLTSALRWHLWSDEAATCAPSTKPSFTRSDPPCPHPLLLLQRCVDKKQMLRVEIRVWGARMATPALYSDHDASMCKQAPDCDHHPYADAVATCARANHNARLPFLELIHDIVPCGYASATRRVG